jgi:hypothetical protein
MQVAMLLWSYFVAVVTDPGKVPAGWSPFDSDEVIYARPFFQPLSCHCSAQFHACLQTQDLDKFRIGSAISNSVDLRWCQPQLLLDFTKLNVRPLCVQHDLRALSNAVQCMIGLHWAGSRNGGGEDGGRAAQSGEGPDRQRPAQILPQMQCEALQLPETIP